MFDFRWGQDFLGSVLDEYYNYLQEGKSPFNIVLKKKTIAPGGSTVVVITSTPGVSIKGFLIQARVGDTPVGQFMASPKNYKTMNCLGGTKVSGFIKLNVHRCIRATF